MNDTIYIRPDNSGKDALKDVYDLLKNMGGKMDMLVNRNEAYTIVTRTWFDFHYKTKKDLIPVKRGPYKNSAVYFSCKDMINIEVKENQPIKFVTYRNRAKKDGSKSKNNCRVGR